VVAQEITNIYSLLGTVTVIKNQRFSVRKAMSDDNKTEIFS